MKVKRKFGSDFWVGLPPVILVLLFVGLPVLLGLAFTLGFTGGLNSVLSQIGLGVISAKWGTLRAWVQTVSSNAFINDAVFTVWITILVTFVVLSLSIGVGLFVRLRGGVTANLFVGLGIIPLFIPVVIASWAIVSFYQSDGFISSVGQLFGVKLPVFSFTWVGVVFGLVWTSFPFALLMIVSGLQSVPDFAIEAARDAGAGFWRLVFNVILPYCFVPLVIAGSFTGIGVLGSFTVPYFIGGNAPSMLGVSLFNSFTSYDRPQQALIMGFFIFVIAFFLGVFYIWANLRNAKQEGARE